MRNKGQNYEGCISVYWMCVLLSTLSLVFFISTLSILDFTPVGKGILTVTSDKVCVHVYLSVRPPFPSGAGELSSASVSTALSASDEAGIVDASEVVDGRAEVKVVVVDFEVSNVPSSLSSNTSSAPLALLEVAARFLASSAAFNSSS